MHALLVRRDDRRLDQCSGEPPQDERRLDRRGAAAGDDDVEPLWMLQHGCLRFVQDEVSDPWTRPGSLGQPPNMSRAPMAIELLTLGGFELSAGFFTAALDEDRPRSR